jgi:putative spermidine/putrescine transport system permease protein
MSLLVSIPATAAGLVAGRALRRSGSSAWLFIAYLPFVLSPVVVGICLYDLLVRLGWASTLPGVIGVQFIFAFAFATVFFCEMWNPNIEKAEWLVATLGGGRWATWRHAIIPKAAGLIAVCWMQCALFSWLDYGLVSVIGGGNVRSLTLMLFAYIREASVNQAAQSGVILMIPPVAIIVCSVLVLARRARVAGQQRGIHG